MTEDKSVEITEKVDEIKAGAKIEDALETKTEETLIYP